MGSILPLNVFMMAQFVCPGQTNEWGLSEICHTRYSCLSSLPGPCHWSPSKTDAVKPAQCVSGRSACLENGGPPVFQRLILGHPHFGLWMCYLWLITKLVRDRAGTLLLSPFYRFWAEESVRGSLLQKTLRCPGSQSECDSWCCT